MKIDRQRLYSLRLPRDYIAFICLAALVLSLTGCTKSRKEPYLALESASVVSPEGRIELEAATKRSKGRTPQWSLGMWTPAENMERRLSFHPLSNSGAVMSIVRPIGASGPGFEVIEIFYQLNDGSEIALESLQTQEDEDSLGRNHALLRFTPPENLVDIARQADGHVTSTIERINDQSGDIHRFYIRFMINGEQHVLDASFKIKLDTIWYGGGSFGGLP